MRNLRYVTLALTFFLVFWLSGCVTPTPPVEPGGVSPTLPVEPVSGRDFFAPNQFIALGPDVPTVEEVVALSLKEVGAEGLPAVEKIGGVVSFTFFDKVMVVYEFKEARPATTLADLVITINERGEEAGVIADLNFLTLSSPAPTPTPPGLVFPSPWSLEGSPHGPNPGKNAPANAFPTQWAFHTIGLGSGIAATFTGDGVRLGVFDTYPCENDGDDVQCGDLTLDKVVTKDQSGNSFRLPPPPAPGPYKKVVRDHGVFVAGLSDHVAPQSEIYLYRVLSDYGQGYLSELIRALSSFMAPEPKDPPRVINLSLGVQVPDEEELGQLGLPQELPTQVQTLAQVLQAAYESDAVVVAAAGNDSAGVTPPKQMQIPARYPFVIGAAASNVQNKRACFSDAKKNNGFKVAGPGGDGFSGCRPKNQRCRNHPGACVMSVAPTSSPQTGYAYWTGTSFSTPLVSGLAALVIQKRQGRVPSPHVAGAIMQGACPSPDPDLPTGVINLPHTLQNKPCP